MSSQQLTKRFIKGLEKYGLTFEEVAKQGCAMFVTKNVTRNIKHVGNVLLNKKASIYLFFQVLHPIIQSLYNIKRITKRQCTIRDLYQLFRIKPPIFIKIQLVNTIHHIPHCPIILNFYIFNQLDNPSLDVPRCCSVHGCITRRFSPRHGMEIILLWIQPLNKRRINKPM